jgi:Fe-S cluster assembly ATP-binding protein
MTNPILDIQNLQITVEEKVVLEGFNLSIKEGQVVALLGPNGSGKSSVAMTLLGNSNYKILDASKIQFLGKDLKKLSVDERAKSGLYIAWQNPVSIPGVTVFNFCKSITTQTGTLVEFKKYLEELLVKVGLPKEYLSRGVNEGFSGGERKRLEMLQLLLLSPKLAVLDEVDSGLDTKGVQILAEIINELKAKGTSFLLITHNTKLTDKVKVDQVCMTTN